MTDENTVHHYIFFYNSVLVYTTRFVCCSANSFNLVMQQLKNSSRTSSTNFLSLVMLSC